MEMQRQAYPALLVREPDIEPLPWSYVSCAHPLTARQSSLQPSQAVAVVNDRVKLIGKINADIADWLQVPCHHHLGS